MIKIKSQSTELPQAQDATSSETTVYINTNIVEVPATKDSPLMYNYDVEAYTKEEYEKKLDKDRIAELETKLAEQAQIVVSLVQAKTVNTAEDLAYLSREQKEPVISEPIMKG